MKRICCNCEKEYWDNYVNASELYCHECNSIERNEKEIPLDRNVNPFKHSFIRETKKYVDYSNKSNEGKFLDITSELFELYEKKNKDYGNAFGDTFEQFGIVSAVIRLNDKMNRLKKLTSTGSQEVKDESIRDTLVDLANYAIMTIMEIDKNEETRSN